MEPEIEWLGHSSVRIRNGKLIYIDPFNLQTDEKADIILITHGHYDHCSISDIRKIAKKDTVILATTDCSSKLAKLEKAKTQLVTPGQRYEVQGILIETVHAYNLDKDFHPKTNDWVGYVVTVNGTRIYHAGDTDLIPEMKLIKADVTLLPVGGTYTMNAGEAANAANLIKPRIAIPMHYGSIVGTKDDAASFEKKCTVPVKIL